MFSNDDKVAIMTHANSLGSDAVDYLQQCEEHIKILMDGDVSEIDMLSFFSNYLLVFSINTIYIILYICVI